jgi:hypothetical protein
MIKSRYDWSPNKNVISKFDDTVTYFSEDTVLQRNVCLKHFIFKNETERKRLISSTKDAMLFTHQNLCSYHDVISLEHKLENEINENDVFVVTELIDGGTIVEFCNLYKDKKVLKKLILNTLNGIDQLHKKKSYHPNLNANNILIKKLFRNPTAKLSDYLVYKEQPNLNNVKVENLSYVAPEQFNESLSSEHMTTANIWSFGVVFFEILAEYNPFFEQGNTSNQVKDKILNTTIDFSLLSTSPYLNVIKKCLERNLNDRYQSVQEIISNIELVDEQTKIESPNIPLKIATPPDSNSFEKQNTQVKDVKPINVIEPIAKSLVENPKTELSEIYHEKSNKKSTIIFLLMGFALLVTFVGVILYLENSNYKKGISEIKFIRNTNNQISKNTNQSIIPTDTFAIESPKNIVKHPEISTKTQIVTKENDTEPNIAKEIYIDETKINSTSKLPDLSLKESEISTLNLNGVYPNIKSISVKSNNSSIEVKTLGNNIFFVRPIQSGSISINVYDNSTRALIDSKTFFVKSTKVAKAYIGNDIINSVATKSAILTRQGIRSLNTEESFKILSFRMRTTVDGIDYSKTANGYQFSEEMKSVIQNSNLGQTITFDQIKAVNKNGESIKVNDVYVQISEN